RHEFSPKPGYGALVTMGRILGDAHLRDRVEWSEGVYAFRFDTAHGQEIIALCSPTADRVVSFTVEREVRVVDAFGEALKPVKSGDTSVMTLDAGFPVYISGQGALKL